jgi:archaellum component FlaD/FlaE
MIKIEIFKDGVKTTLEREKVEPLEALDDLLNLLFVTGFELENIEKAILDFSEKLKNNHKNDTQTFQNTRSL